jgi:transcriptional regulator with XRE-family HTH domain
MSDPDPFASTVAAELRAELARQNHSRRWLAEQVGHSHVTVSRWLNDGHMPASALLELCHALGISAASLIGTYERGRGGARVPHPRRRADDFLFAA